VISGLKLNRYWLTFLLILLTFKPDAQNVDYSGRSYGADYNIWNGRKYYIIYFNTIGHPFFNADQFRYGTLFINDVLYQNVMINYDICNQHVICQQIYGAGQIEQIILTNEFINEFTIDGKLFRRLSFPETGQQFFQIIRNGDLPCFLYWEKKVSFSVSTYTTEFSSQSAKIYLLFSGRLCQVRTTSELISITGKQYRGEIKRFKRTNNISFRKVTDENLGRLIDYCISLKNKNH
jgi:hypothetical protein